MKAVGSKGRRRNAYYLPAKSEYLNEHTCCELCAAEGRRKIRNLELHHKAGRAQSLLWNKELFCALCHPCHMRVHANRDWSYENGWLVKLTKEQIDTLNTHYRRLGMW